MKIYIPLIKQVEVKRLSLVENRPLIMHAVTNWMEKNDDQIDLFNV